MIANPLRRIRKAAGLTQAQVAIGAGITPQVVLKAEQGLFGLVPPRLIGVLAEAGQVEETELEADYAAWQAAKRLANRELILNVMRDRPVARSYADLRMTIGGSTNNFCKLLCLHPAQWTRLERDGGDSEFFIRALKDAELEWLVQSLT